MNVTSFKSSILREVWEHKVSVVWVPIGLSFLLMALFVIAVVKGASMIGDGGGMISFDFEEKIHVSEAIQVLANKPVKERQAAVQVFLTGSKIPFDIMLGFVALFYFLSCLFDERKDRSIYFWRSMPVSDWQSVLSKLVTGMVLLPAVTLAAAVVMQLFVMMIGTFGAWYFGASAWDIIWSPSNLILHVLMAFGTYMLAFVWMAPIVGFLMLLSAVTNRPMLYMLLIPGAMMLAEEIVFDSSYFAHWLGERFMGAGLVIWSDMEQFAKHDFPRIGFSRGAELLGNEQFWIGLLIGAVFLYTAVYARKRLQEA